MAQEDIRITRYWDTIEKRHKLDVRYWKQTRKGLRPTNRGIDIPMHKISRMIQVLQREHADNSAEEARLAAATEGTKD